MWKLSELIKHASTNTAGIKGKWVPARPLNYQKEFMPLKLRIKDAWEVFMCRAESFKWPMGQ